MLRRWLVCLCLLGVSAPVRGKTPHPEPRVIVTVTSVRGPHSADGVQRAARLGWGRIVRCYKGLARGAKGTLTVALDVAKGGAVSDARVAQSTMDNRELDACLVNAMQALPMPTADRDSTAMVEIRLAPGDKT